jgi:phosphate transport system substrate-binding protein
MTKILLAILILVPCASLAQAPRIEADAGAANLLAAAQEDYARTKPGAKAANVLVASTRSALAKLCRGEIEIAGAARTMTASERALCAQGQVQLVELPVGMDSVAVVASHANSWAKQISVAELKRAWLDAPGRAATWRQLNASWPESPLKLYGPGPNLGLSGIARAALTVGDPQPVAELRRDISATEVLSVVVEGVSRDGAGLGLLDRATYTANMKRVRLVPVSGDNALAFPLYVYAGTKALQHAGTLAVLDHMLANGARLAAQSGLSPLAPATYQEARQRLATGRPR